MDIAYVANVQIGTTILPREHCKFNLCFPRPQVALNMILDTGSSDFWINSEMCRDIGCVKAAAYYVFLSFFVNILIN